MSYADALLAAANEAKAKREPNAPTVISTFAGGGGSSTGYHMAGYAELLAVEWDDHACETLRLNYPSLPIWKGDIANLKALEVLERTGLKIGELDLLDGSPPCQGFSTAGERVLDDPRNQLFREFTRLLTGLQPKAFVMENVTGLIKGKMKGIFLEILAELKSCGYQVASGVLNASYLGVPQARERVIFIGARNDLEIIPTMPKPQMRQITVKQSFEGLPSYLDGPNVIEDPGWYSVWAKVRPGDDFGSVHPRGSFFNTQKLHPNKPAPTILKELRGSSGLYHWEHPRLLNIAELTRVSSFPDDYRFPGDASTNKKDHQKAWARIGNAVPPLMARAIGRHIRETILKR